MIELDVLVSGSLRSVDPDICGIARQFLAEAGLRSVVLLQAAVASGELSGKLAADCMAVTLARCEECGAALGAIDLAGYKY
jgi:hypothetical protein